MVTKEEREAYEEGQFHREHPVGGFIADLVQPWRHSDSEEEAYDKSLNGEQLDGDKKDDSCCYITSACLKSLGLTQNSLEFKAMKTLTKEHILKSRQGKRDYIIYGRKAPGIVERIGARIDAEKIWEKAYEKLETITELVLSGRYEEGYQSYKSLVIELGEQF